jgi:uncharacterized protein (UPF0332 family)
VTDQEALYHYRMKQACETLADARSMLQQGIAPRSIINRVYYALFYSILALFINRGIQPGSSKHTRIISLFDREFVATGILDRQMSRILHRAFDARQEGDYKEFTEFSPEEAAGFAEMGEIFMAGIQKQLENLPPQKA